MDQLKCQRIAPFHKIYDANQVDLKESSYLKYSNGSGKYVATDSHGIITFIGGPMAAHMHGAQQPKAQMN